MFNTMRITGESLAVAGDPGAHATDAFAFALHVVVIGFGCLALAG